jgi:hypothetical protein
VGKYTYTTTRSFWTRREGNDLMKYWMCDGPKRRFLCLSFPCSSCILRNGVTGGFMFKIMKEGQIWEGFECFKEAIRFSDRRFFFLKHLPQGWSFAARGIFYIYISSAFVFCWALAYHRFLHGVYIHKKKRFVGIQHDICGHNPLCTFPFSGSWISRMTATPLLHESFPTPFIKQRLWSRGR